MTNTSYHSLSNLQAQYKNTSISETMNGEGRTPFVVKHPPRDTMQ